MMHTSIANDHNFMNLFEVNICRITRFTYESRDRVENLRSQRRQFFRIKHRIRDARHKVSSILRLRIDVAHARELFTTF